MKRALILVEGQTEERFVKDTVAPFFVTQNLSIVPTILQTKRLKNGTTFKGGVSAFSKIEDDIRRLLGQRGDAMLTTMIDYYGLPDDTPGMADRAARATASAKVWHVEQAIAAYFGSPKDFLPFLALHEFEAWLFVDSNVLPSVMTALDKRPDFAAIRTSFSTPEEINERPEQAPSKRIERLFPAYRKTLHGPMAAKRIGVDQIRVACPHFDEWMRKLELFARS